MSRLLRISVFVGVFWAGVAWSLAGGQVSAHRAAVAGQAVTRPLTGHYLCEGINPVGAPYRIELGLLSGDGQKWQLHWRDQEGEYVGLGYVTGQTMSVAIALPQGRAFGLAIYTIDGQTLTGTWMAFGTAGTGTETCRPANQREARLH